MCSRLVQGHINLTHKYFVLFCDMFGLFRNQECQKARLKTFQVKTCSSFHDVPFISDSMASFHYFFTFRPRGSEEFMPLAEEVLEKRRPLQVGHSPRASGRVRPGESSDTMGTRDPKGFGFFFRTPSVDRTSWGRCHLL